MGQTSLKDIIKIANETNSKCIFNSTDENKNLQISTDSREDFNENKLFLAIKGDKFNGNDFALDTYNKGCRFFILSENINMPKDANVVYTDDSVLFFIKLAREYRRRFNIKVVSITGSCGKTTTKELTALFLGTKYKTLKTEGNFNNEIGVPKTIFNLDDSYEMAVIEAGMNHKNELLRISEAIEADTVIINNVEPVHIAFLGSLENIALAKSELFNNAKENAIINKNTNKVDILLSEAKNKKIKNIIEADIKEIKKINDNSFVYKGVTFNHNLIGDFNLQNILMALKAAELYNIDLEECAKALINYQNQKNRMQIIKINNCSIINDCYNSNPTALKNMLIYLSKREEKRKIAIIGDMLETETQNSSFHKDIGIFINSLKNINEVITVGDNSQKIDNEVTCSKMHFKKVEESINTIIDIIKNSNEETAILIKASLGMRFNMIIEAINNI